METCSGPGKAFLGTMDERMATWIEQEAQMI